MTASCSKNQCAMKNILSVSIKSPCSEKWDSFTPAEQGAFCHRCQKKVADLTRMNERELLEYLNSRKTATCARLRTDQLGIYHLDAPSKMLSRFSWFKAAAASVLLLLVSRQGLAQTKAKEQIVVVDPSIQTASTKSPAPGGVQVVGLVTDEAGNPFPGASIIVQGTTIGTTSDVNGRFVFAEPVPIGSTLVFGFIGFEPKTFKLKRDMPAEVEVVMKMDEWQMMGELTIDAPYAVQPKPSFWSKVRKLF